MNHSDLNSNTDFVIRPPPRHPIHDAYILIQNKTSLKDFLSFLQPSHDQLERNDVLFALQITVGDAKTHYRKDHDISIHDNPRKYQVIADVANFVQEHNLYYAEIYISPNDPQDDHINWWPTNDLCPWFAR